MSVPIFVPSPISSPFLLFIYIECVLFNDGMTTLSCVAVKALFRGVTVAVVALGPRPPLSSHLTRGPVGW